LTDKPAYIKTGGTLLDLSVPKVMGIINITTDSFYSGSRVTNDQDIVDRAVKMIADGADIIDIGGYSSRPGALDVSEKEEGEKVFRATKLIHRELPDAVISVDTFRSAIAREAVEGCGAQMINDISGGDADPEMFGVVEKLNVPYILMHMKGNPATMQSLAVYDDIIADILKWFGERIVKLQSAGVKDIIIDPGFGFSKTVAQNFEMLRRLRDFSVAGLPLLAGLSRKTTIWKTLDILPEEALNGTSVLNTIALLNGADILRVHDVKEAVQAIKLVQAYKK
jgi:dihydropteroate synthase